MHMLQVRMAHCDDTAMDCDIWVGLMHLLFVEEVKSNLEGTERIHGLS